MSRIPLTLAIAAVVALASCAGNGKEKMGGAVRTDSPEALEQVVADLSIPGNFSTQDSLRFDSAAVEGFLKGHPSFSPYASEIRSFYRDRRYAFAWHDARGRVEQSTDLYNRIINITDQGLSQEIPYLSEFRGLVEGSDSREPSTNPEAGTDLMFTAQYFHYARRVWGGLPEHSSRAVDWHIPRKRIAYHALLDSLLAGGVEGGGLREPVHRQYLLLRDHLRHYRAMEKGGLWKPFKAVRRRYAVGDTAEELATLRRNLHLTGDLSADDGSRVFDAPLEQAVRRFQHRMGLKEDGIVGAAVSREVNVPPERRIRQIIVNMERTRWIAADPVGRHLVVNIPQYQLLVYDEKDSLAWSCRVVVGKQANQTAIFQGSLKQVVFSPYWNVPASILEKEILPALRRNPNYLQVHDMEWVGRSLRQRPGPSNALGKVKFLFPNSFNMYLHDTPSKSLFEEDRRAFSHGCIRVAEPRRLALYLLGEQPGWDPARVDSAMAAGKEMYVNLSKPVPVSILYLTAWVDPTGRIHFNGDVYQRDERLMEMIFSKN